MRPLVVIFLSGYKTMGKLQELLEKHNFSDRSELSLEELQLLGGDNLLEIEEDYQSYLKILSPAYLSGSSWYVGPSLIKYLEGKTLNRTVFAGFCYLSHVISKHNQGDIK